MDRRTRAFREFAGLVRDDDRPFADRVTAGLELGCAALGLESGTLARVTDGEHTLLAVATDDATLDAGEHRPLSETFCELPVTRRETVAFEDIGTAPAGTGDRPAHTENGFTCYIGAPVTVDDQVYGTCCFAGQDAREPFADWERELVSALAAWTSDGLTARAQELALNAGRDRLDGFAAMVDHDIREPLSTARGAAQLAREAATDGDAATAERHVGEAVAALSRMDRLVGDLLRLSSDSERAAGIVPADVRTVAEHSWAEVTGGDRRDATLHTTAGVHVTADESLLKRLLAAVFRFCLDTRPDGLRVRVGPLDDRPGFFVADDGPGFPGENDDRPPHDGDGLDGIERIAAAHDWTITAGLSADGGIRVEVETGEGLWPEPAVTEESGPTVDTTLDVAGIVDEMRADRDGDEDA
jgi:GAF domain-containing protein